MGVSPKSQPLLTHSLLRATDEELKELEENVAKKTGDPEREYD